MTANASVFWLMLLFASGCSAQSATNAPPARGSATSVRHEARSLPSTGSERLRYAVSVDERLSRIDVELCPHGFRIERLEPQSPFARELLGGDHIITPEGEVPCPADGVDLPRLRGDECLKYSVLLPNKSPDPTGLRRVEKDLLASPDLWLWQARPRPLQVPMRVHFTLPSGLRAALPWPREGDDFVLSETALAWKTAGAFTHTATVSVAVPDAELAWAALGTGFTHAAAVEAWLSQGARASSLLFGHFPVPRALVLGVPGERGRPSFGMALRGGGPAVVILLDRDVNAAGLASDWTCTHEFLHLGVPRLPPEDAWLFEGLATYYTEVVRARTSAITPAQAYQHLLDGFARGHRNEGSRTLREASRTMRENHAFYRVYWGGAALAFLTDVAARRAGGVTLDAALRAFADCCAASEEDWDAAQVLARLDASLAAPRFGDLARTWLDRAEFPKLDEVLRELGVAPGAHGSAALTAAPSAALRDAIMRPVEASEPHAKRNPHE